MHLGLSPQLHSYMKIYVEQFRPHLPKPADVDSFFVNYSGNAVQGGDIANILTVELCQAGYKFRASCTKFRKMTVTMVIHFPVATVRTIITLSVN